jgi:hypothetical protein
VRKEFIVERQGRSFCLYAGLLDVAHQQGLKSIQTELIQIPTDANNRVAICSATVVLEQNGVERQFTGLGDAAPNNVAPAMQTCLLRMAETRAKARALRDAVNIGVAAFEELGEDDEYGSGSDRADYGASSRSSRQDRSASQSRGNGGSNRSSQLSNRSVAETSASSRASSESRSDSAPTENSAATETQLEAIRSLCRRQSVDAEALASEKCGVETLTALTHGQAVELIRELNGRHVTR